MISNKKVAVQVVEVVWMALEVTRYLHRYFLLELLALATVFFHVNVTIA